MRTQLVGCRRVGEPFTRLGAARSHVAERNFFFARAINVSRVQVDKNQVLRTRMESSMGAAGPELRFFRLVLELLSDCGMILRARLLTSSADGRCRWLLNFRDHYSSVILRNGLNLSGGSRV
jgi:hypothetical protein